MTVLPRSPTIARVTSALSERRSRWLADRQTLWFVLAAVDLIAVAFMLAPGNPVFDLNTRRYRAFGTALSHLGVLLLLLGFFGRRHKWLDLMTGWSRTRRTLSFALAGGASLGVLAAIASIWPAYARALLREWGLLEPVQVGLFLVAAWIASEHAALNRSRGAEHRPYRLTVIVCLLLVLEEVDYFGIPGAFIGRIGRVYVGSFHDLVNLAEHYPRHAYPVNSE